MFVISTFRISAELLTIPLESFPYVSYIVVAVPIIVVSSMVFFIVEFDS